MRPSIISGGPSSASLQAKQHTADKGVDGGFAGLVFTVHNIQTIGKGQVAVVKLTEPVNV